MNNNNYILTNDQVDWIRAVTNEYNNDAYDNYDYYYRNLNNIILNIVNNVVNNHHNVDNIIEHGEPMEVDVLYDVDETDYVGQDGAGAGASAGAVPVEEEDSIPPMAVPLCPPLSLEQISECLATPCGICYRDMELVNLTITRCGHIFHASCMNDSLMYNAICPFCRTQLH